MNADSLLTQVEQLFNLLASRKVDYVLVGGIAVLTYVEGRNTQDIDLIMALPSLAKMPEIKIESQDMYFVRGKFGELQIDILSDEKSALRQGGKELHNHQKVYESKNPLCHGRRIDSVEVICITFPVSSRKLRAGCNLRSRHCYIGKCVQAQNGTTTQRVGQAPERNGYDVRTRHCCRHRSAHSAVSEFE